MRSDSPPEVSVVICSYRRNEGLRRAAASILTQALPAGLTIELVLVDNNPDGSAAPAVAALAAEAPFPVRYVHATMPNIAHARNAGIAAARGKAVAFMDDDEEAVPEWVAALHATAQTTGADLVFGPTEPVFESGPPAWDPTGERYRKRLALPDGAMAPILGERGHAHGLGVVASGNVLIGRACLDEPEPFDPAFGRSGGEDSDFFRRQIRRGRRAAWSERALVHEHIPPDRTELDFMVRRAYRESQTFVRFLVKNSPNPGRTGLWLQLRGGLQAVVWAGPHLCRGLLPADLARRARFGLAHGLGKLRWRRAPRAGDPLYN
jgi:glycosyltransferase involved in cell wall biosynthesis